MAIHGAAAATAKNHAEASVKAETMARDKPPKWLMVLDKKDATKTKPTPNAVSKVPRRPSAGDGSRG